MTASFAPFLTGFLTSLSLILAIGAQNAFVLQHGLRRLHIFWICLFCGLSDALLILAGVAGFAQIIALFPLLPTLLRWGGAIFLLIYGLLRFRAAWHGGQQLNPEGETAALLPTLLTCAALTWLNPHVYLDTLGLIGAISTGYLGAAKIAFGVGAVLASFVFFFSLGFGAQLLRPYLNKPRHWQWLDMMIGLVMWGIALSLILGGDAI